ncbi:hypothetical protein [Nostoc sp. C052]|nr:hypothetical protein [Nostoc sp. C052]
MLHPYRVVKIAVIKYLGKDMNMMPQDYIYNSGVLFKRWMRSQSILNLEL